VLFQPDDWIELRLLPERDAQHLPTRTLKPMSETDDRRPLDRPARDAQRPRLSRLLRRQPTRRQHDQLHLGRQSVGQVVQQARGRSRCRLRARIAFADFDRIDEMTVRHVLVAAMEWNGLPFPAILIDSAHGVDTYWLFKQPTIDLPGWTSRRRSIPLRACITPAD
jgi:hypothetical protein